MNIRPYLESDHIDIADLFHQSVHAIDKSVYSLAQLEAWSPTPPDYTFWQQRLAVKRPFIALRNDIIIGFIELESDGHIDCLYVHPSAQGHGVARRLLLYARKIARNRGITSLHVEASKVAMPLFKKFGFKYVSTNSIVLREQSLLNYTMTLTI